MHPDNFPNPARSSQRLRISFALGIALVCGACSGPNDDGAPASAGGSSAASSGTASLPPLSITRLELAQTHVLPEGGLAWAPPSPASASERLHLTGGRGALALVKLSATDVISPVIEGLQGGASLGTVPLSPPASLPATEAHGPAYATDLYSAMLPASWLAAGVQLRVKAANYSTGATHAPEVGAPIAMATRVLPFYLFGATDANSGVTLAQIATPPAAAAAEMLAKWPIASLDIAPHAAVRVSWPQTVIAPRNDSQGHAQPAYVVTNATQQKDGFAVMSSILGVLSGMRSANGDAPMSIQYYAPLVMLDANSHYADPGGGLGQLNGDTATGNSGYSGIFIHEQGHALGLPHAGEAFDSGQYPYAWGSLSGSAWGYDAGRQEFLPPFVPSTAPTFAHCASDLFAGHARTLDASGRCVKQDPMQSGAGDQASGYAFATFADYSTAVMQRHLEGRTTANSDGTHAYSGGKLVRDAAFNSGYKRWDGLDKLWVDAATATQQNGLYGLDNGLPKQIGVPVQAVSITLSNAGTAGATQIDPPFGYTGNLMRVFDPTNPADRAAFTPDTGTYPWFCRSGGCDYTLRVTYADGNVRHVLLQGGFRPFNAAAGAPAAASTDPLNAASFHRWVVNVPGSVAITRLELLSTPQVWNGMPANPPVLAQR